jgi:hypothetical protein
MGGYVDGIYMRQKGGGWETAEQHHIKHIRHIREGAKNSKKKNRHRLQDEPWE